MATISERTITITYSEDTVGQQILEAATNDAAPGQIEIRALSSGANTITVPDVTNVTPTAVTIVPPAGNTISITLKGVTGDTGVRIHDTDPTSLSLDPSVTTFVLTAGSALQGLKLFWS